MKIKKSQLRRIIQEEKSRILAEESRLDESGQTNEELLAMALRQLHKAERTSGYADVRALITNAMAMIAKVQENLVVKAIGGRTSAEIQSEQKTRAILRRLLEGQSVGTLYDKSELDQAIQGKHISIGLGGFGMYVDVEGAGTYNADDALGELWGEMGPDGALAYLKGIAASVAIDPDTAEDLGL